jgi:cytosine deaminase
MTDHVAALPTQVLQNALLPGGQLVDVHVTAGRISAVAPVSSLAPEDAEVHDLAGWLLLPALAEPHAHLDKALTAEMVPNPTGDLIGAIEAWLVAAQAGTFIHDDIVQRSTAAMEMLVLSGVTAVRSHINVGEMNGVSYLRAVREARTQFEGLLDVQLVALPAAPMTGSDGAGNRAALVAALTEGVDLIGGCPHLDPDGSLVIADVLRIASEAQIGVDLHVDETLDATVLELRTLARQVIDTGFEHPVTASHCVSLGVQPEDVQREVAKEVAEAQISVVALPQTNLFLQGRQYRSSMPRGLTAIAALREAGAQVVAGADNVQDPFNLMGRSDPLETAALMVMAGHVLPDEAYEMVSNGVRSMLGLEPVSVAVGSIADLLAIRAPSIRGALAGATHDRMVFRHGRLVATSSEDRRLVR